MLGGALVHAARIRHGAKPSHGSRRKTDFLSLKRANRWKKLSARFDFKRVPEDERAPKDPSIKIVGLAGQTRGSVGVVYDMEKADGGVERIVFSGGTVGFSTYLKRLDTFPRTLETDKKTLADSVHRLAEEEITSLLPGRGARVLYDSAEDAREDLDRAADDLGVLPNLAGNPMLIDHRYAR